LKNLLVGNCVSKSINNSKNLSQNDIEYEGTSPCRGIEFKTVINILNKLTKKFLWKSIVSFASTSKDKLLNQ